MDRRPGDSALDMDEASQRLDWRDQRDRPPICRDCESWHQANPHG
ncbi:MAG: hypothetical protein NTZ53_13815 [Cyanobacteria bacterium]|nr:hypothetical protein [Cyanobacteriota bacterium]